MTDSLATSPLDVAVVGAGVVGLGAAWRLIQRGRRVAVFDRGPAGRGASWAAAGMLAPAAEAGFEEQRLYDMGRESLRRWPAFAADLEAAAGASVGYVDAGTLLVADDRDAARRLRRQFAFQREQQGANVEWLSSGDALDVEPLLSPRVAGAIWSPDDHHVDPRRVVAALASAVAAAGALRENAAVRAVVPGPSPAVVLADGTRVGAGAVIVAAGAWTAELTGMEPAPAVRPVKGQAIALRMAGPFAPRRVIRTPRVYLVPQADGRLVVGATSEEAGFDTRVTAGGIYRLLDGAVRVVPGVEELEIEETWAGLRPAGRGALPMVGRAAEGVWLATAHYRHGFLLAPLTADEVASEVDAALGAAVGSER